MLKIYLARHGYDLDNQNRILNGHRNEKLTDQGIEQAHELAIKIKESSITFNKIYSSPLQRAFKTAEIIATELNINEPEIMSDLIERNFGVLTGQPFSKIVELSPNVLPTKSGVTYFLDPKDAETFPELIKRGKKVIEEVNQKHKDGNILLVTHGDFGKMIYAAYYNLDWKKVLEMFHFGNSDLLLLSENSNPNDVYVFKTTQFNPYEKHFN